VNDYILIDTLVKDDDGNEEMKYFYGRQTSNGSHGFIRGRGDFILIVVG
jgi:hypothetical protein